MNIIINHSNGFMACTFVLPLTKLNATLLFLLFRCSIEIFLCVSCFSICEESLPPSLAVPHSTILLHKLVLHILFVAGTFQCCFSHSLKTRFPVPASSVQLEQKAHNLTHVTNLKDMNLISVTSLNIG